MSKVLIKQVKPSMVLVKKGVAAQYPLGAGGPILVAGGGGRGGGTPRGRTKRERVGSALGATAGALGALTGQHRSLGGLVQGAISGGAQGASLGGALGRKLSGRSSRALADVKEGEKQARSKQHAEQGTGLNRVTAPIDSRNRRVGVRHADELARVNRVNAAANARMGVEHENTKRRIAEGRKLRDARNKQGTEERWGELSEIELQRNQLAGNLGVDPKNLYTAMNQIVATGERYNPHLESSVAVLDAAGVPMGDANQMAQSPQNSRIGQPPLGSVGSNNQTADRVGQGVTDAQGFNNTTEGEPSDLAPPAAMQPPEGQGQLPEMTANEKAIESYQRLQAEKERRRLEEEQSNLVGVQTTLQEF